MSVTAAAYVDLGQIVGALTSGRRQTGAYLSLQVGFWRAPGASRSVCGQMGGARP